MQSAVIPGLAGLQGMQERLASDLHTVLSPAGLKLAERRDVRRGVKIAQRPVLIKTQHRQPHSTSPTLATLSTEQSSQPNLLSLSHRINSSRRLDA